MKENPFFFLRYGVLGITNWDLTLAFTQGDGNQSQPYYELRPIESSPEADVCIHKSIILSYFIDNVNFTTVKIILEKLK
jgi:hypothetical protein